MHMLYLIFSIKGNLNGVDVRKKKLTDWNEQNSMHMFCFIFFINGTLNGLVKNEF